MELIEIGEVELAQGSTELCEVGYRKGILYKGFLSVYDTLRLYFVGE